VPGVYISYPFCRQKCSFCNFASDVGSQQVRGRYEAAVLEEIRAHKWEWAPETVYFGGGTPSLMPPELLAEMIRALPQEQLREVTLECAPGTLNRSLVASWTGAGVNRVSLGVQSFVAEELKFTGRRHSAEEVERDADLLRAGGIENINLDLIAGLPEQTGASWERSLEWIERIGAPHVSVYLFEVDEDSRLGREYLLGGLRYGAARMPSDDAAAQFYERAVERLKQMDYARYEISNFARAGYESLHNLKYWKLEPYIGFGLDAHSYDGGERWQNPDSLNDYLARAPQSRSRTDRAEEHFFVGLRMMSGIEPTAEEWTRFAGPIEKWTRVGLLERDGARLRLTPEAVLVSNEIFAEFVA
jgi:oxygen-independent coproporphyrinogen-3 oxidase